MVASLVVVTFRKILGEGSKQQVPPLRYAPVGMTIHLKAINAQTELSSRPERSVVEGPAVASAVSRIGWGHHPTLCHPDRSVAERRDLQCALPRDPSQWERHPILCPPTRSVAEWAGCSFRITQVA
jgi:hypothetical protein